MVPEQKSRAEGCLCKHKICYWCCCLVVKSCLTLCNHMDCSMPGFPIFTISWSLLKLMSIESVMPSNHLILYGPLLLLPSIFASIRISFNESALYIRWLKYWSFSIRCPASNLAEGQAGAGNCSWKWDSHSWRLPLEWCLCVCAQSLCCSLQFHRL